MKKLLAVMAALTLTMASIAEAKSFGGFGGRSSFSSSRSYSMPSRSYSPSKNYSSPTRSFSVPKTPKPVVATPKKSITYKPVTTMKPVAPPRPVVINKTTIVRQNSVAASVNSQPSFWSMFLPSFIGAGIGSYAGSSMAQPSQPAQPKTEYCPDPIPQGYNKPCVPLKPKEDSQWVQ